MIGPCSDLSTVRVILKDLRSLVRVSNLLAASLQGFIEGGSPLPPPPKYLDCYYLVSVREI